jgi:hypothetical protein
LLAFWYWIEVEDDELALEVVDVLDADVGRLAGDCPWVRAI